MMFGNIEAILPANEAFLHDLKACLHPPTGYHPPEHWAQAMLRHVRTGEQRCFLAAEIILCIDSYNISRLYTLLIY